MLLADLSVLTITEQVRLENLLASWQMRADAMPGPDRNVILNNIAALKAAIGGASLSKDYRDAWAAQREANEKAAFIVEEVRTALDEMAAFRGPRPKRADMARLSNRLQTAFETLGGQ